MASKIACVRILESKIQGGVQKLAEACNRFTPQIAIGKREIYLELTRSMNLFSEANLKARISILARRLGLIVKITFADHLCRSVAKSYFPNFEKTEMDSYLPLEALFCFLNPFESDLQQEKEVQSLIKTLRPLGVQNIAQFLELTPQSLGSRFGKRAVLIYSFAKGESDPVWKGYQPSPTIEESLELRDEELEGDAVALEPLLFCLKKLMDRALNRMIGLGQRASKIQIELQLSSWSTIKNPKRNWEISFPVAQGTSLGILPILRERLTFELTQAPLLAPAQSLQFKILETVPGHGAQRDFFQAKEVEAEAWDELLGRLLSQLGEEYVFQAALSQRHCPEQSWIRTLNAPKNQSSLKTDRPSRILKAPEPLQVKPSLLISSCGKFWKVQNWQGPERITSEWWKQSGLRKIDRDYYHVLTQENERLWIFFDRAKNTPQAYLHGFFD